MYFMVFFEKNHVEILNTLDKSSVLVKKEDIGKFIDMLLEAQELLNKETLIRTDIFRRVSWIKHEAKVFPSELVEMGLVIPIQKQATIAKNDDR